MSQDKKELIKRLSILTVLFFIQIIWFVAIFTSLIDNSSLLELILKIGGFILILYLVMKDESPAYRMSWIIVISILPLFGVFLYLFVGNKRPTRWMSNKINRELKKHSHEMECVPNSLPILAEKDKRLSGIAKYIHDFGGKPLHVNNKVEYYPNGESMMEDLINDLWLAEQTIFIEFFIVEPGKMYDAIFEVLIAKAKEGLDVRFIYDDFGSLTRLTKDFDRQLEELGIKTLKFNPVKPILSTAYNTRDHRKFILIDSKIGYTGGVNIADEYINLKERFGYWKDNMIRIEGTATWNLTNLFLNMWNAFYPIDVSYEDFRIIEKMTEVDQIIQGEKESTINGFVQPYGDSPLDNEPLGENVYREILNNAQDYVYIYTPYLVISYELQTSMQLAAKRGVRVILMTPGIPDKPLVFRMTRSYYRPLLEAGVKIYEYSPGFLHAKTFISDDKVANVGTINLDFRSLYLHFETSTMIYYHPVIKKIKFDFEESLTVSKEIKYDNIRVGFLGSIWDAILRLIAPLI